MEPSNIELYDYVEIKSNGAKGVVVFDAPLGYFMVEEESETYDGELYTGLQAKDLILLEKSNN